MSWLLPLTHCRDTLMHERLGLPLQYNIRYQCQCRRGASVKNLNTAEVGYVTIQNGGCADGDSFRDIVHAPLCMKGHLPWSALVFPICFPQDCHLPARPEFVIHNPSSRSSEHYSQARCNADASQRESVSLVIA